MDNLFEDDISLVNKQSLTIADSNTGGGFPRVVISDFRSNFFKISDFRLLSS